MAENICWDGMVRIEGVSQLFIKRDPDGQIILMIAKVTDDLLMTGTIQTMQVFAVTINKRFEVRKALIDGDI